MIGGGLIFGAIIMLFGFLVGAFFLIRFAQGHLWKRLDRIEKRIERLQAAAGLIPPPTDDRLPPSSSVPAKTDEEKNYAKGGQRKPILQILQEQEKEK